MLHDQERHLIDAFSQDEVMTFARYYLGQDSSILPRNIIAL